MRISVVIPALDEEDRVAGAIESAIAPGTEICVVDGGSRDRTVARARDAARAAGAQGVVVRVLEWGGPGTPAGPAGRARQLRAGTRATSGDVVLFLHADTLLPRGFGPAVRDALAVPGVVGGAFRFRFGGPDAPRTPALRLVEWGARLRVRLFRMPYGDQALFVRRRELVAIGGVPQVPLMEDLDMVAALRRRGRLAALSLPATTSPRRHLARGVWRTSLAHTGAALAWAAGIERRRIAGWLGR